MACVLKGSFFKSAAKELDIESLGAGFSRVKMEPTCVMLTADFPPEAHRGWVQRSQGKGG